MFLLGAGLSTLRLMRAGLHRSAHEASILREVTDVDAALNARSPRTPLARPMKPAVR
jgi:hypothetical protein